MTAIRISIKLHPHVLGIEGDKKTGQPNLCLLFPSTFRAANADGALVAGYKQASRLVTKIVLKETSICNETIGLGHEQ